MSPGDKKGDFASAEYKWASEKVSAWQQHQAIPEDIDSPKTFATFVCLVPKVIRADGDIYITKEMFDHLEGAADAGMLVMPYGSQQTILMPKWHLAFTEEQKKAYRDGTVTIPTAPTLGECIKPEIRANIMAQMGLTSN